MKLVAVGDNCIDEYSDGTYFTGGNPVNVSVFYTRNGGDAAYVGVVGNDKYGDLMLKRIDEKGVDVSHVRVLEGKTAVTQVELIDGERVFGDYDEGVLKDFSLDQEQIDFISKHDLLVSGLWSNTENYFKTFKELGVMTALDSHNRPYDEAPTIAIPYVDYFFYSSTEDSEELRNEMKDLHAKGPKLVIATLGSNGSIVFDGTKFYTYGIIDCEVLDTMGAGDSYIAGFLNGISNNQSILECMELGARTACETISYSGTW